MMGKESELLYSLSSFVHPLYKMSAPLQAFTESGLKASLAKKDKNSNSRSKSKSSFTTSNKSKPKRFTQPKQRGGKKTKETILFDDAKRNEFLTGFSKRKNARKEAAKKYAESKILEERKAARKEVSSLEADSFDLATEGWIRLEKYKQQLTDLYERMGSRLTDGGGDLSLGAL